MRVNIDSSVNDILEEDKASRDKQGRFIKGHNGHAMKAEPNTIKLLATILRTSMLEKLVTVDSVTGQTMIEDSIDRVHANRPADIVKLAVSLLPKENREDNGKAQFAPLIIKADNVVVGDAAQNIEGGSIIEDSECIEGTIIDSTTSDSKLA